MCIIIGLECFTVLQQILSWVRSHIHEEKLQWKTKVLQIEEIQREKKMYCNFLTQIYQVFL